MRSVFATSFSGGLASNPPVRPKWPFELRDGKDFPGVRPARKSLFAMAETPPEAIQGPRPAEENRFGSGSTGPCDWPGDRRHKSANRWLFPARPARSNQSIDLTAPDAL